MQAFSIINDTCFDFFLIYHLKISNCITKDTIYLLFDEIYFNFIK